MHIVSELCKGRRRKKFFIWPNNIREGGGPESLREHFSSLISVGTPKINHKF